MTTFAPTALRASELARCPRMCALRGLGAASIEPDEQTRRYFARGHLYTEYVVRQLRAKHGADQVDAEVEIDWGVGVGHADAFVKPARLLVEVKSTVTPAMSTPMFEMSVWQLKIYLRHFDAAERGALYLINPSDLSREEVIVVVLTDEDIGLIDAQVALVRDAVDGGSLPDRVCRKPSEARGRLCGFAAPCFEGWVPEAPTQVTDPAVAEVARRLFEARREYAQFEAPAKAAKAEADELKEELAGLVEEGETTVGPWTVQRTHVRRQPSFSLKAAKAAGFPVHTLDEFMRPGAEYDLVTVSPSGEAGELDYGDEAPF